MKQPRPRGKQRWYQRSPLLINSKARISTQAVWLLGQSPFGTRRVPSMTGTGGSTIKAEMKDLTGGRCTCTKQVDPLNSRSLDQKETCIQGKQKMSVSRIIQKLFFCQTKPKKEHVGFQSSSASTGHLQSNSRVVFPPRMYMPEDENFSTSHLPPHLAHSCC